MNSKDTLDELLKEYRERIISTLHNLYKGGHYVDYDLTVLLSRKGLIDLKMEVKGAEFYSLTDKGRLFYEQVRKK